ncbi:universal stress protein [Natrialba taiwanensis]|uniref:UspA domain-containing protein n=1 Tax=Natrialba taiwanensis DSM 12281 TaxID=1230458 RepID=L9ZP04_9EURY|nr:universal stress protein [Natrialba taiwanensis]ELY88074.1 UspA domain-containing protein [Natrialba taiwanensis DSM 12281]
MPEHVLVPIDRSQQSRSALTFAVEEYPDATITLLHVIDVGNFSTYGTDGAIFTDEFIDQLRAYGTELLDDAHSQVADRDVTIETELEIGTPAQTITEYISTHDIDHVVMGSHGRHGVSRVLLGSVAETVTRRSPVPVTIVR